MRAWQYWSHRLGVINAILFSVSSRIVGLDRYLYSAAEAAQLLPDPVSVKKLTWIMVKKRVSKCAVRSKKVNGIMVDDLLLVRDKRIFSETSELIWPARTSTDLSLRRTRLLDWVRVYRRKGMLAELREVLLGTNEGWDLIFVTNLLVATYTFGIDWWRRWCWLGAFDGQLDHYVIVTKLVHNIAKTSGIVDDNWTYYVEATGLTGYRNLPYEGFDVVEEAKLLASGGEEHNYFGHEWVDLCKEYLPMPYKYVEFVPFEDWIRQGNWLTSGASSIGRVEFDLGDGKVHKVKARKNVVMDVTDIDDLVLSARTSRKQINVTVIKSELSKLRVAVAGDLYTYLQMTWITELLGGCYYSWPGNTSEEDFLQQTTRLNKMLVLCSTKLGLPYDYAGFDHQPTTDELLGIVNLLCSAARRNVPEQYYVAYDEIVNNIIVGWKGAILRTTFEGETIDTPVTGGLGSGLRWTSIVGNAWNSVITGLCMRMLDAWGIPSASVERFIRGDDSAIFVDNWSTGAAVNAAYDAIGARAGAGKFSLQCGKMEFLRVWFDSRCRGYPCRSIPGLTQRKPWSSAPWSEDMILRALYDGITTTKRRLNGDYSHLDVAWSELKSIWCRDHNLPITVTQTPIWNGGLGIEPMPVGKLYKIEPPIPKLLDRRGINIVNVNGWRKDKLMTYAAVEYKLDISDIVDNLVQTEIVSTLTSDTVPDFARHARQLWLSEVRLAQCKLLTSDVKLNYTNVVVDTDLYVGSRVDELMVSLKTASPIFGSCPELVRAKADYDKFNPGIGLMDWLRLHFPRSYAMVTQFHKSWHISDRIDYLTGKMSFCPEIIHPALIKVVSYTAAKFVRPSHSVVRGATLHLCQYIERIIAQTQLSKMIYWW